MKKQTHTLNLDKLARLTENLNESIARFDDKWMDADLNDNPPKEAEEDFKPVILNAIRLLKEVKDTTLEDLFEIHDTTKSVVEAIAYSKILLDNDK